MERLGLGPDLLRADNPRLVYGRLTGWGQDGPLASQAGHDINYLAVAGALGTYGRAGPAADAAGQRGGRLGGRRYADAPSGCWRHPQGRGKRAGSEVDAAIVDGAALQSAQNWSFLPPACGGTNAAPTSSTAGAFYDSYVRGRRVDRGWGAGAALLRELKDGWGLPAVSSIAGCGRS
jgi:alpha-methylacyl-CoA racemase